MTIKHSVLSFAAVAAVAVSALGMSSAAQARDVAWSIGINSPGVQLGVSNAPRVVYPQPAYVPQPAYYGQAQTVYYGQPQVVYAQPPLVYASPRVVYAPAPYYVRSGWAPPVYYPGWGPRHHGRGWDHDRR